MANKHRIKIEPEIIKWAIKESGKSEDEILKKFPNIVGWMNLNEKQLPTFKQAENFANYLKIPFGYLFLSAPPKKFEIGADFRSINNIFPKASKNLKDTIIDMTHKQNWLIEYRKSLGYEFLEINKKFKSYYNDNMNYEEIAHIVIDLIDLDHLEVEKMKNSAEYYNFFRKKFEDLGISVFQNGIVGGNTGRKLDINEFRAFVLIDEIAPVIFINNRDSVTGKIFSIVHEFTHILLGEDDIITKNSDEETFINNITSEILAPRKYLLKNFDKNLPAINQIEELSKRLKISRVSIAIKLLKLNLITNEDFLYIKKLTEENVTQKVSSGGNYYNSLNSRLSENFKKDVISSVESNNTSYTEGFRLLGNIKSKAYDSLKEMTYGV